ncbi:MAG TPA: 16S rRNA (cytidine(1402)-2'-O)-methyltransferase [Candidatus Paceibacterota bacterium]
MPTLYIVATPIGNLEDITLRALRVLSEVDVIFCEDTRVSQKLLKHFKINKPLKIFYEHTLVPSTQYLAPYENIAYVTDAGTPGVSDPGAKLVAYAREQGINVVSVPGPSAITSLISISGLDITEFTFLGFLPHKKGRETLIKEIAKSERAVIVYESPHRIIKFLNKLSEFAPDKKVIIGRELTKKFEEVLIGKPSELVKILSENKQKQKGEFAVLVTNYQIIKHPN